MKKRACLRAADNSARRCGVPASRRSNHKEPRDQPTYLEERGCRTRQFVPLPREVPNPRRRYVVFPNDKSEVLKILVLKHDKNVWISLCEFHAKGE